MNYRTIMKEDGTLAKVPIEQPSQQAALAVDLSTITDDDLRRECRESLVMMLRSSKGEAKALPIVRELLDRLDGKPVQGINLKATIMPILQVNLNARKQDNI